MAKIIRASAEAVRRFQIAIFENKLKRDMEARFIYVCPSRVPLISPMIWSTPWPGMEEKNDQRIQG